MGSSSPPGRAAKPSHFAPNPPSCPGRRCSARWSTVSRARPRSRFGELLNATVNFILTRMAAGLSYETALAEAQRRARARSSADVGGHDAVAKVMILSALVFGRQLRREQVYRGVADLERAETDQAASSEARLKHVATLGIR